jgi:hypothetical protein
MEPSEPTKLWTTFAVLALAVGLGCYGMTFLPPWIVDVVCDSYFMLGFDTCLALVLIFVGAQWLSKKLT